MIRLRRIPEVLSTVFFPTECRVCGGLVDATAGGIACEACWRDMQIISPDEGCRRCSYPLPVPSSSDQQLRGCIRCRRLHFGIARACGKYEGALRASILHLKNRPHLSERILDRLHKVFEDDEILRNSNAIMPVPLHPNRLRERGFNQAEIIAESLARRIKIPMDADSLIRVKETAMHRGGMDVEDRASSLSGAFRAARPRLINGASILLVDDLFTTGNTLSAGADVLLSAGAKEVYALTIARVVY